MREEIDWEAREDARTLARAEEIKADKARAEKAKREAEKILKEREKELQGIKKIVRGTPVQQPKEDKPFGRIPRSFDMGFPTSPRF